MNRNDKRWTVAGIFLTVFMVVFFTFVTIGAYKGIKKENACEEAGGRVLNTRSRSYCLDPEVFVDVTK